MNQRSLPAITRGALGATPTPCLPASLLTVVSPGPNNRVLMRGAVAYANLLDRNISK
jgi:hypothetical protein